MRAMSKHILVIGVVGMVILGTFLAARHFMPMRSSQGDMLDFFVYNSLSGETKAIYTRFSQVSYTFAPGDVIEYDVRLSEKTAGAGGIEILTSDNQGLRDEEDWVDQKGLSGRPSEDLSKVAYQAWYHRVLPIPASFFGKTVTQWALAGENDTDGLVYEAQYANIRVTNGNGAEKLTVFKSSTDFHWGDLHVVASENAPSASLSPVAKDGGPNGQARVVSPLFPTDDVVIADFVATDPPYSADSTGVQDSTTSLQQVLTDCYNAGGGTVWLPAGQYRVTGSLHIPAHVTLRGDWRDPDTGTGSYGTVIRADVPSGNENDPGLFNIWGSAGVKGLTVYYPNQNAAQPVPYPYTFEILGRYLGEDGHMSSSVQNVTLLNSYLGISAGKDATHEIHTLRNIKGTVLSTGIYLQDTADVGKVERVTLNNSYWASLDASVAASHPSREAIDAWTLEHGTGLLMGGVEWDQITDISLADYSLGIGFVDGRRIESTLMMFGIRVEHSHVGMRVSNLDNRIGLVVSNGVFHASEGIDPVAIEVTNSSGASAIFNNVIVGGGAKTAVRVTGSTTVSLINSTFDEWTGPYAITASSGTLAVEGSTFVPRLSAHKKGILLEQGVYSAALLANYFPAGGSGFLLEDRSSAEVKRQDDGISLAAHGVEAYPWRKDLPRPATDTLYDVRSSPYHTKADGQSDDTAAIQSALDAAGHAGGGIVYLPAGIYRLNSHLTIPAGVELRGSDAAPHRAMAMGRGTGTILLAYEGRDVADPDQATPFIFLDGNGAGVRGLSIHYPEQATQAADQIVPYPWTIQGKGDSVYAIDIALSNAWRGVDFATYPTDHHYINSLIGLALNEGIRVGNSTNGQVEDCLFNINAWGRARGLPGMLDERQNAFRVAGKYTRTNLKAFVVTTGAKDEFLLSVFVYGAHNGFTFESSATATGINVAADGGVDTFIVDGTGPAGVKVINSEGCGCGLEGTGVKVSAGSASIWNLVTMEPYKQAVHMTGGKLLLQGAAFHRNFALIDGGETLMNAVLFRDAGNHVTIRAGQVDLWGNMGGRTVFKIVGAPASEGVNIRR